MKLHEALKRIVAAAGKNVLQDERLTDLLSSCGAFDGFADLKEVMKAFVSGGYAKALCGRNADAEKAGWRLLYTAALMDRISGDPDYIGKLAGYAADSVSFALDLADREPLLPEGCSAAAVPEAGELYRTAEKYFRGRGVRKDLEKALTWYLKAAEKNSAGAEYALGLMYRYGRGVSPDREESVRWFRKAAEQGDADAQYQLASHFSWFPDRNHIEAARWYKKAAEQGNAAAQYGLGELYDTSPWLKDRAEAVKWYAMAAEQGYTGAMFRLSRIYERGQGVKKNSAVARKWFRKSNEYRHASILFEQGEEKYYGARFSVQGRDQSYDEALELFRRAAMFGNVAAMRRLSFMYANGRGVEQDLAAAERWSLRAAEQSIRNFQESRTGAGDSDISVTYEVVDGELSFRVEGTCGGLEYDVEEAGRLQHEASDFEHAAAMEFYDFADCEEDRLQDCPEAMELYVRAIESLCKSALSGNMNVCEELGDMFYRGDLPGSWLFYGRDRARRNPEEAFRWYSRLLQFGYFSDFLPPVKALADMYCKGEGTEQDSEMAALWYRLAARHGDAESQKRLGYMYEHGEGVQQNLDEAAKWYSLSAGKDNAGAERQPEQVSSVRSSGA